MISEVNQSMVEEISTNRRCKNIRDRIFDPNQKPGAIFKREMLELVSPDTTLLDLGCGRRATFLRSLSPFIKKGFGVDLDIFETVIKDNIEMLKGNAEAIPLPNHSIDVITMINVVEHFQNPRRVFLDCQRVLKPGGSLVLITPNKYYPPILIGRAVPHRLRQWANVHMTGTKSEDTFPTYYRANSAKMLLKIGLSTGLNLSSVKYLSNHPAYFMFSTVVYRCASAVELYVLKHEPFRWFRQQIFCRFIKPE